MDQQTVQDDRLLKVWEDRRALALDLLILVPMLLTALVARSVSYSGVATVAESLTATALFVSWYYRQCSCDQRAEGKTEEGKNLRRKGLSGNAEKEDAVVDDLVARFRHLPAMDGGCRIDACACRRFLRAWKGDVEGAADGLQKYVEWRRRSRPADITEDDVCAELATRKGYAHGLDRYGHPIFWAFAARHDKADRDLERTVKLILFNLEECIRIGQRRSGSEKVCLVFDLSGFGSKSMDFEVVKRLFHLLANYYPERLGRVLLWNAPQVFNGFWHIISPFIDPVSFQKVRFVGEGAIVDNIHPSMLPDEIRRRLRLTSSARSPSLGGSP